MASCLLTHNTHIDPQTMMIRYHFDDNPAAPSVELCLDEVKSAMEKIGFEMLEERDGIDASYIADDNSMMRTA